LKKKVNAEADILKVGYKTEATAQLAYFNNSDKAKLSEDFAERKVMREKKVRI
jgi:hypothetical protein